MVMRWVKIVPLHPTMNLSWVARKDYIVNYRGVEAMVSFSREIWYSKERWHPDLPKVANLNTKFSLTFRTQSFSPYAVQGHPAGKYKNAGTFSYLRVFAAGHEVPAYGDGSLAVGQAALQFFNQIMSDQPLHSTWSGSYAGVIWYNPDFSLRILMSISALMK